ncbi:hypothetical protein [Paraferrimonas haliotis]|uniref:Lipoprotein n=1 Tax=Paraferrimonas haliotis TaxID=2013866 RepID=A0AA37X022_9GAMM|nr:hypothetical protein [Paraferrimonas haliotis]GLS84471.1 hypothetical protein GCM10007894_24480 [Paraferrimonas haliotis]
MVFRSMLVVGMSFAVLALSGCVSYEQPNDDPTGLAPNQIIYSQGAACTEIKRQCGPSFYREKLDTNGQRVCHCDKTR